jgi:S-adenosylmethionine uptake transporter
MRNDTGPIPILGAALGILFLSVMDGFIKSVAGTYPATVVVLMRFVFGGLVALAYYLAVGAPTIERATLRLALVRGVFVVVTAGMFFAALGMLPLVEVIALSFVAPIIIALFGRLFLGEAIGVGAVLGIVLGSAGVVVMLAEQFLGVRSGNLTGVVLVLLSTVTYAASLIILRKQATRDPLPVLVLLQNWIPAFYILPLALWQWTPLATPDISAFVAIGVLGALGHVAMTWAFARATAARLGVVEYTALVWAALIGFVWFGEVPTLATLAGACLIVIGAVSVSWTPRRASTVEG